MKKIIAALLIVFASCTPLDDSSANMPPKQEKQYVKIGPAREGIASHYSIRTNNRSTTTASGIPLRDDKFTAASLVFPLRSTVKVTNVKNGKTAIVKITDTGPFATDSQGRAKRPLKRHPTRIIDVSQATAKKLGFYSDGLAKVKVQQIKLNEQ